MNLSIIVATAENGVIGKNGKMPWRLPDESKYFRQVTSGHPIITGRKNFEAVGRALPDRLNIIVTRQTSYGAPPGTVVVHSIDEALALPEVAKAEEAFIVGGAEIYNQALPLADKLYLTQVHAKIDGDTFFTYEPSEWKQIWSEKHPADEKNEFGFTKTILERTR